jgi:NAD(P)-dependent dehydrogenase (short-subunit alcohol dehydrogenase family)
MSIAPDPLNTPAPSSRAGRSASARRREPRRGSEARAARRPAASPRSPALDGRVALVTGAGHSSAAIAAALADNGASVVLGAPDNLAIARVARGVESRGGRALALATDPTDPLAPGRLTEAAVRAFGRLDLAVNAPARPRGLDDRAEPDCRAVYFAVRHQLPAIAASGGGAIVNVALGLLGWSDDARCVAGLTRASALEHGDTDVRVNALAKSPTSAGYAATAVWLCSDAARHLNGAVVSDIGTDDAAAFPRDGAAA